MNVTFTIETTQTVSARLDPTTERFVHQHGGDWLIQLIDPKSTNQDITHEYRGSKKEATFDVDEGVVVNVKTARLDTDGNIISATMVMGYTIGSGGLEAVEVPASISITE